MLPRTAATSGTHTGVPALQAKGAGFNVLDLSGAAMGPPDLAMIMGDEVISFVNRIIRTAKLPRDLKAAATKFVCDSGLCGLRTCRLKVGCRIR